MTGSNTERDALAQFEALLGAYGAEPRRWPTDRRAAAEALLARSPEAQSLRAAAAQLDGLLDSAGVAPAPAHLVGRVLAAAPGAPTANKGWFAGLLRPAAGLAFAAVLGLGLGGVISPFAVANGDVSDAESVTLAIGDLPEVDL
jgi:anti-sigma factor RsiW